MRRPLLWLVVVIAVGAAASERVVAHAGPRSAEPAAGARLGDSPEAIRLSFTERPEISLSAVRVLDASGRAHQSGDPQGVANDPHSLVVRVRRLDTGIYTVIWRVVSAVDGHATEGTYSFGVRASPAYSAFSAQAAPSGREALEVCARVLWLGGLLVLLGGAAAHVLRFGGPGELWVAGAGWLCASAGIGLLIATQVENASISIPDFINLTTGRVLAGRVISVGAAAVALAVAATREHLRRDAQLAVCGATLAAMAIHVVAGHAGAGAGWQRLAAMTGQWTHFAAAGVWCGGLLALLVGTRGAPSSVKAIAVRRFSTAAGYAFVLVMTSGIVRAFGELSTWRDLWSHPYGQTLTAKFILVFAIAAAAAWNRWASVPRAQFSLRRVRLAGGSELVLAIAAVICAGTLGVLAPPRAGVAVRRELAGCGVDFATTMQVCVSAASDEPGPNRFVVRAIDVDSGESLRPERVTLRFQSLEDHAVAPTALMLQPDAAGTHVGSGANLAFPGRWRITATIQHAHDAVEVPLDMETSSAVQPVSALRVPGAPPEYHVMVPHVGQVHVVVTPERAGRNDIRVAFRDMLGDEHAVDSAVFTWTDVDGGLRQETARQIGAGTFALVTELATGSHTLLAAARLRDGTRMRSVLDIVVPASWTGLDR